MKPYFYTFLISLLLFASACEEIVQDEIDKEKVRIIAPTDSLSTTLLSHTFLWEPVEKAEGYILQMATPSFKEVQELVLNEQLEETVYEFTLSPGKYEWRVKAYNNISETEFTTYYLSIDSSLNLNGAKVILSEPADNHATNQKSMSFSWQNIAVADEYRFEVRSPDWATGSPIFTPVFTTAATTGNIDFSELEGSYEWAVQAENSFSKSDFSTPRKIVFDFTAPGTPGLSQPTDGGSSTDSTIVFQWSRPSSDGSAIQDSLYIYTDKNQTNLLRSALVNATTKTDSFGDGTYYWKVRSIDAAGNKSAYSQLWSFTIQ
jgi:hypothetical protein